jgi:hypothetical protein
VKWTVRASLTCIETRDQFYLGWCPVENDLTLKLLINEVLNFTIFVKNFIEFPPFNVKHKNMAENLLYPCIFDDKTHTDCPIFSLNYIVHQAESDAQERIQMLLYGAVIRMKIDWDCDLDRSLTNCKPEYSFARLDVPFREQPFSKGFNFRFSSQWNSVDVRHRSLTKAYGLRLIIAVSGKAGQFDFITLTLNIGSMVGIFGLATFLCDLILLQISKEAPVYRSYIFESVHLNTRVNSSFHRPSKEFDVVMASSIDSFHDALTASVSV